MQDLMLEEMMEAIDDFTQYLNGFFFGKILPFLDIAIQIPIVAVFQHEVVIVGGLLHIVQFDDVVTLATLQHFDLALEQLFEFAYGWQEGYP
jgi:hypothetical protein